MVCVLMSESILRIEHTVLRPVYHSCKFLKIIVLSKRLPFCLTRLSELWLILKCATLLPHSPLRATSVKTCPPRIWQGTLLLFALVLLGVLLSSIGDTHLSGPAMSSVHPSNELYSMLGPRSYKESSLSDDLRHVWKEARTVVGRNVMRHVTTTVQRRISSFVSRKLPDTTLSVAKSRE